MFEDIIDIDDICLSPHQKAYESFLQINRLIKGEKPDENIGLYGLLSKIFPIESKPMTANDGWH